MVAEFGAFGNASYGAIAAAPQGSRHKTKKVVLASALMAAAFVAAVGLSSTYRLSATAPTVAHAVAHKQHSSKNSDAHKGGSKKSDADDDDEGKMECPGDPDCPTFEPFEPRIAKIPLVDSHKDSVQRHHKHGNQHHEKAGHHPKVDPSHDGKDEPPPPPSCLPMSWDVLAPLDGGLVRSIFELPRGDGQLYLSSVVPQRRDNTTGNHVGLAGWLKANSSEDRESVVVDLPYESIGQPWTGWAIGDFQLDAPKTITLFCPDRGVQGVYINDRAHHYNCDVYDGADGRRYINMVDLPAGNHTAYISFIGEPGSNSTLLPAMFEILKPQAPFKLSEPISSDIVDGYYATQHASVVVQSSVPLRNIVVTSKNSSIVAAHASPEVVAAAGQMLPLHITLEQSAPIECKRLTEHSMDTLHLLVSAEVVSPDPALHNSSYEVDYHLPMRCKRFNQSYVFTFMDADSSVQYAHAVAPKAACPANGCPVLVGLHGASVDIRAPVLAQEYKAQNAWVLMPSNRGSFGFDWEGPGLVNVWMTLHALALHLPGVPAARKAELGVNRANILYQGHSMGGHGCLVMVRRHAHAPIMDCTPI